MPSSSISYVEQAEGLFQRRTRARRRVLDLIVARRGPFSAEEIYRQAPQVGRATVYRTISQLVSSGFLCRVMLDDGDLHYQVAPAAHHHHLVCVRCDRVVDVESCEVTGFVGEMAATHGFTVVGHRLEVYVLCSSCRGEGVTSLSVERQ